MKNEELKIRELYSSWAGAEPERVTFLARVRLLPEVLPPGKQGEFCDRRVFNEDRKENDAFIAFSLNFQEHNLPVPLVHATDSSGQVYLLSDLGDQTLFGYLSGERSGDRRFSGRCDRGV
jgi:aminoglycoside/choline kinase family phosphotransferase